MNEQNNDQAKLEQIAEELLKAVPLEEGLRLYNERPKFYDAFEVLLDHPEYDAEQIKAVIDSLPENDRDELRRLANVIQLIRSVRR